MNYPILCLLPNNRYLTKDEFGIINTTDCTTLPSSETTIIFSDATNQVQEEEISLQKLGEIVGFIYTPHLIFLHEKEYRNSSYWGLECEGLSHVILDSNDCSDGFTINEEWRNLVTAGQIIPGLAVRYIDDSFGYGLFTTIAIESNSLIGEYVGIIYSTNSMDSQTSTYVLSYPSCDGGVHIDAKEQGNIIRFVNHSKCSSNVVFKTIDINGFVHVICVSNRRIEPNEQLLVNYGSSYWKGKSNAMV